MRSLHTKTLVLLSAALLLASSAPLAAAPKKVPPSHQHAHSYATGTLAGHQVSDLYADYVGYKGVLPKTVTIDWDHQLSRLWERKVVRSHGSKTVNVLAGKIVTEYRTKDPERVTLAQYTAIADQQAKVMYAATDWKKVAKLYRLNGPQTSALQTAARDIGGRELVGYAMTELLPGRSNGPFNASFLDFLLRNAGRRYVESIPAIHDGKASFGTFQFTELALYDANGQHRGASKLNQAVHGAARIPGSTILLRGNDHFRAAWLFGVNNLAESFKREKATSMARFQRVHKTHRADLVQFLAVSHNKPANGRKAEARWLANHANYSFRRSVGGRASGIYAAKTASNYASLSKHP